MCECVQVVVVCVRACARARWRVLACECASACMCLREGSKDKQDLLGVVKTTEIRDRPIEATLYSIAPACEPVVARNAADATTAHAAAKSLLRRVRAAK